MRWWNGARDEWRRNVLLHAQQTHACREQELFSNICCLLWRWNTMECSQVFKWLFFWLQLVRKSQSGKKRKVFRSRKCAECLLTFCDWLQCLNSWYSCSLNNKTQTVGYWLFGICAFGRCHLFLFLMNFLTSFYLGGAYAVFGSLMLCFYCVSSA